MVFTIFKKIKVLFNNIIIHNFFYFENRYYFIQIDSLFKSYKKSDF
jgi:hypothetical protein